MTPPLYQTVIETIIARITSGELRPGVMLASESDLGVELGVSQGTARKALSILEQRGIVRRRQGVGTFVTVHTPESALFHFFRLRKPDGSQVTPVLGEETVSRRKARQGEKAALFGSPDMVFEIARVRCIDGRRLVHEHSVVSAALFPGLSDRSPLPNALYALYQQAYSCAIVRAEEKIRACQAGARVAEALGIEAETPVLEVERIAIDLIDRAVEKRVSVYVTDGLSYGVSLS